jgi:hypothetical protein
MNVYMAQHQLPVRQRRRLVMPCCSMVSRRGSAASCRLATASECTTCATAAGLPIPIQPCPQVLWTTPVGLPVTSPVRLLLSAAGDFQLQDSLSNVMWSSKTRGMGSPPHVLQVSAAWHHLLHPPPLSVRRL